MGDDRFICGPVSILLDLVRGAAALVVLVGHAVQLGLYTGPYPFSTLAQHNAVVVFFVLSGLVIGESAARPGVTLRSYALARAARILPVALPAVAFAAGALALGTALGAAPVNPSRYDRLAAIELVLPLLFLSESPFGAGPPGNPPYWSLCYEVWFYALFGAAAFLRGGARLAALAALALVAGPRVLLMLPVWLVGVALARRAPGASLSPATGAACVVAVVAAFPIVSALAEPVAGLVLRTGVADASAFGYSLYAVTDLALGGLVALAFVGLRPLASHLAPALRRAERPIRGFAGLSFTLYLFHWPMLGLLRGAGVTAGASLPAFAGLLLLVILACAALATVAEHRRAAVRRWLEAAVPPRARPALG